MSNDQDINISIFGVGLIGGSLAMCFKGKPGLTVTGFSHDESYAEQVAARGVVDKVTLSIEEAAQDADLSLIHI